MIDANSSNIWTWGFLLFYFVNIIILFIIIIIILQEQIRIGDSVQKKKKVGIL